MGPSAPFRWIPLALMAAIQAGSAWAADAPAVGFRKMAVPETAQNRALEVAVWYPTDDSSRNATLIGDNPAFVGVSARVDAAPQLGRHPLVVLSHGYGGNWTNEQWLAADSGGAWLCRRRRQPSGHDQPRHGPTRRGQAVAAPGRRQPRHRRAER